MPEEHERGHFVWYELMTTDPAAAQGFYSAVTGWGTAPFEGMEPPYTMWMRGEVPLGGVTELPAPARQEGAPLRDAGAPSHWLASISTGDVDAAAERTRALGGSVRMPPMDIPQVGRYAVLVDPQGAQFAVYKSSQQAPAGDREAEPGEFSWHELATTDHRAAFAFYSDLFGWVKTSEFDMGEAGIYQMYGRREDLPLGGMFDKPAEMPGPPAWVLYVRVPGLDRAVATVSERGGQVVNGPMEVPGGDRIAQCLDPQGALFALHEKAS